MGYESSPLDRPALFCMSASGNILQCKAAAIGRNSDNVLSFLEEAFSHDMDESDLIAFMQSTMRKYLRWSDDQDQIVDEQQHLSFETFLLKDGKVVRIS